MKITYRGDYALKAVLDLAVHNQEVVAIHELAKRIDAPVKFLEQVLLELKRGGFVASRRGKIGGYLLARHPSQIHVGEVVRFIDGPLEPIDCVVKNYTECRDITGCAFRPLWSQVKDAISKVIDNVTFEDLVKKTKSAGSRLTYQI